jgi:hypothetical protein
VVAVVAALCLPHPQHAASDLNVDALKLGVQQVSYAIHTQATDPASLVPSCSALLCSQLASPPRTLSCAPSSLASQST